MVMEQAHDPWQDTPHVTRAVQHQSYSTALHSVRGLTACGSGGIGCWGQMLMCVASAFAYVPLCFHMLGFSSLVPHAGVGRAAAECGCEA